MPPVVAAEAELARRAQHAVGPLAPELSPLDLETIGHRGAEGGEGHPIADGHVEGSTADLQRLTIAGIDVDQLDLVGIGVWPEIENLGDDDALEASIRGVPSPRPRDPGR